MKTTTSGDVEVVASYAQCPAIAVDSDDHIHVIYGPYVYSPGYYGGGDGKRWRERTPSGWGPEERFSQDPYWGPVQAIAIDGNDNVHVAFRHTPSSTYDTHYRSRSPSGWGTEIDVGVGGNIADLQPSIAIDSTNNVHIVWAYRDSSSGNYYIKYRQFTTSWQPIVDLEGPTAYPQDPPTIAIDSKNNIHVVWSGKDSGSPTYYQIRYREYTTSWQPIQNLTSSSSNHQTSPSLMWANYPEIGGIKTNVLTDGYAFVWNDGSDVKFYKSCGPAPSSWTFTAPYNDCVISTWNTPSPPQGDSRVLSQGFSTAVAACDVNAGTFKYKIAAFGGTSGGIGYGDSIRPPNQAARAEGGLVLNFIPPFTGDLRIEASLTINGKAEASARSGLAASINAVDEIGGSILDWLIGKKVSVLLTILKALKASTAAKARTDAFLLVSGGATGTAEAEITPSLGATFPWGYYRQNAVYDGQALQLSTVVHVTQGQQISISVGTKSHVESWGWASSVVNLALPDKNCQVNSIVLSKQ